MSDLDPTEDRLRRELHAIGEPPVDVERVLGAGRRRARRRTMRNRAVAGAGAAGLVAVVAVLVLPDNAPDTVTNSRSDTTPTTTAAPPEVPLGEGTTWPGGPFDPIEGMVAVPDAAPLSDEEAAVINDAERRLISECMARHGVESSFAVSREFVGDPPLYLSPDQLRAGGFDYDYDWAAAGAEFLDLSDGSPEGWSDPTAGMTQEERDAYEAASSGTSEDPDVSIETHDGTTATWSGGCVGESQAQLYGSVANSRRYGTLDEPFSDISGQLREHDEYEEPLADWQACMGESGFDVGDHDYGASYIRQAGGAALSTDGQDQTQFTAETIPTIAAADADCQESSGLYEVRVELLDGITEDIAADLGVDLDHYVAYERALYARAQQIP
jgi:hypothetical protein